MAYSYFFKRLLDIVISAIALVVFSPVIVLTTAILAIVNTEIPFFLQDRPGKNKRIFRVFKFKTMNDRKDNTGNLLPDSQRLTVVGRFIRSSSLDELPQLINVVKGDMSLVGPRPLLIKYLPLYNDRQARRHEVRPGITGWAQVNGRNAISWKDRFELDIYYVDHISFWLDMKIIYMTIKKVMKREGINAKHSATMEAFKGN